MKQDVNKEDDAFYDEQDERASEGLIEDIMATEYATPPPGVLEPEAVWKARKRQELKKQLSTKPFRNRFSQGMSIIVSQLKEHLARPELEKISDELAQGGAHFVDLMGSAEDSAEGPPEGKESFRDLLQISNDSIEKMYQCGVRLAKAKSFKDAADVFFVLSVLDHKRHNIWMALGLNEQCLGHMEPALQAYAMAIITDMKDPWSYLYSAECYQSIGKKDDAKECLVACLAHTSHLPRDKAERIKKSAEKCRSRLS